MCIFTETDILCKFSVYLLWQFFYVPIVYIYYDSYLCTFCVNLL